MFFESTYRPDPTSTAHKTIECGNVNISVSNLASEKQRLHLV
jgi:hypothetical protein